MAKQKVVELNQTKSAPSVTGVPVKWATLHAGTDFPAGVGTHTTLSKTKITDLEMYLNPGYLLVCTKGMRLGVPLAGVKCFWIDPATSEDGAPGAA